MAQWKRIWLVFMRTQVRSLASLSGLRILCCCGVGWQLQLWLDPKPESPHASGDVLKRQKKKKRKRTKFRKLVTKGNFLSLVQRFPKEPSRKHQLPRGMAGIPLPSPVNTTLGLQAGWTKKENTFKLKGRKMVTLCKRHDYLCRKPRRIRLEAMRFLVRSLASLSGLRIRCGPELWCRPQL